MRPGTDGLNKLSSTEISAAEKKKGLKKIDVFAKTFFVANSLAVALHFNEASVQM